MSDIEVLSDYDRIFKTQWARSERHKEKRIEILSRFKTKKWIAQVRELIREAGVHDVVFVKNTGKGKLQSSDYRAIKQEWVDQYENGGYSGDSFSGFIYIQVKPQRFLRLQYAM